MKLTHYGKIKDGKLLINNRKTFDADLLQLTDQEVEIMVCKKKKTRSNEQSRYYRGVVVLLVKEALKSLGHQLSAEETHQFLKSNYNYKEVVNEASGQIIKMPVSTTELSKIEFMEYMDRIKKFAAEFLIIYIPDPNEQIKIEL